MKIYDIKRRGLRIRNIYFADLRDKVNELKCDIVHYIDAKKEFEGKTRFHYNVKSVKTLCNSLEKSEDEILNDFKSNVRNEIRRAKKDGVKSAIFTSDMLRTNGPNSKIIEDFNRVYVNMNERKNIRVSSVSTNLYNFASEGMLSITIAIIDNKNCVYHAYIADGNIARLLFSTSSPRGPGDTTYQQPIGRANRMLHYEDMLFFKSKGYSLYDWGGYSQSDDIKGIDNFKAGFGGQVQNRFHYSLTCSLKGRIAYLLFKKGR